MFNFNTYERPLTGWWDSFLGFCESHSGIAAALTAVVLLAAFIATILAEKDNIFRFGRYVNKSINKYSGTATLKDGKGQTEWKIEKCSMRMEHGFRIVEILLSQEKQKFRVILTQDPKVEGCEAQAFLWGSDIPQNDNKADNKTSDVIELKKFCFVKHTGHIVWLYF